MWLLACSLVSGCAPAALPTAEPTATPSLSRILTVGEVLTEQARAPSVSFGLADGRTVSFDLGSTRLIARGAGEPSLLVAGRDDTGEWLAVIGHQDGTPDDCHVLNQPGYEMGTTIAIAGIRWTKAPALQAQGLTPARGAAYPDGTRFCLDSLARVTTVIPN